MVVNVVGAGRGAVQLRRCNTNSSVSSSSVRMESRRERGRRHESGRKRQDVTCKHMCAELRGPCSKAGDKQDYAVAGTHTNASAALAQYMA